jgi:hypothetical protein
VRPAQGDGDDAAVAPVEVDRLHGGDHTEVVGLNPYRPQRRRTSDYVFVAAAVVVTIALLAWALLG